MEIMPWGVMVATATQTGRVRKGGALVLASHWPTEWKAADGPAQDFLVRTCARVRACIYVRDCACTSVYLCVFADGRDPNLCLKKKGKRKTKPCTLSIACATVAMVTPFLKP